MGFSARLEAAKQQQLQQQTMGAAPPSTQPSTLQPNGLPTSGLPSYGSPYGSTYGQAPSAAFQPVAPNSVPATSGTAPYYQSGYSAPTTYGTRPTDPFQPYAPIVQPSGSPYAPQTALNPPWTGQAYGQATVTPSRPQPPVYDPRTPVLSMGNSSKHLGAVRERLNYVVNANGLQRFYDAQAIEALAQKVARDVNFEEVAAKWKLPIEFVYQFAPLALYDTMIYADDSGSMLNDSRWKDLTAIFEKVSEIATRFDSNGIDIRFFNNATQCNSVNSVTELKRQLSGVSPGGKTPLATNLQSRILVPYVGSLRDSAVVHKPLLVIVITDGEPTDKGGMQATVDAITWAQQQFVDAQYPIKSVAFQFAQVGTEQDATDFLTFLDKHPVIGRQVDCTSDIEIESQQFSTPMTVEEYTLKLLIGPIDPTFDDKDEGVQGANTQTQTPSRPTQLPPAPTTQPAPYTQPSYGQPSYVVPQPYGTAPYSTAPVTQQPYAPTANSYGSSPYDPPPTFSQPSYSQAAYGSTQPYGAAPYVFPSAPSYPYGPPTSTPVYGQPQTWGQPPVPNTTGGYYSTTGYPLGNPPPYTPRS